VRAKDKFGDYGIIGILSMSIKEKEAHLVDFVLSCRVVGRFIEEAIIQFLKDFCRKNNIKKINGTYIKTQKNTLCYQFLQKLKILKGDRKSFILLSNKEKINIPNIKIIKPKMLEKANVS
jgi:FkbH-like protein